MATNPSTANLVSIDDAKERLSISRRLIERLIANGVLRSLKIGRRRLIHERDLDAFIKAARGN